MSQQINLLLPELRPRFDWLALPVVLGAALVGLLFVVAMALFGALQADRATARNAALQGELLALQEQVRSLAGTLGARVRRARPRGSHREIAASAPPRPQPRRGW